MEIGLEQLVWAIIFIIFIIITAFKNRARKKPGTTKGKSPGARKKAREQQEKLGRYLEEILGIESPEPEPQKIKVKEEKPEPSRKIVETKTEPEREIIGEFESPLIKEFREKEKPVVSEKKEPYHAKFPWGTISRHNLSDAIIFSEIIGPPVSKRKSHRLF